MYSVRYLCMNSADSEYYAPQSAKRAPSLLPFEFYSNVERAARYTVQVHTSLASSSGKALSVEYIGNTRLHLLNAK